jgi:ribulose-5-phosphate 4-epimerase/fuculose-1-phosphate aldolase
MSQLRNPFPSPTPLEQVLLKEMVSVARRCYERGWSWGTAGNFSIRGAHGLIWQSPSGLCKGDLRADLFVPLDLKTESPIDSTTQKPSAEMPVHAGIYKNISDAICVVHTHPPHVVAASRDRKYLEFKGQEMSKALGAQSHTDDLVVTVLPNATPEEMRLYSGQVVAGLGPIAKVLILEGHGVWAWGKTPMEALGYIEALETLCRRI